MSGSPARPTFDGIVVACRITPKGGRDAIDGCAMLSDGMRVLLARVRAAPEDGKANAAVLELLARALGVAPSRLSLLRGATSREKLFRIGD